MNCNKNRILASELTFTCTSMLQLSQSTFFFNQNVHILTLVGHIWINHKYTTTWFSMTAERKAERQKESRKRKVVGSQTESFKCGFQRVDGTFCDFVAPTQYYLRLHRDKENHKLRQRKKENCRIFGKNGKSDEKKQVNKSIPLFNCTKNLCF